MVKREVQNSKRSSYFSIVLIVCVIALLCRAFFWSPSIEVRPLIFAIFILVLLLLFYRPLKSNKNIAKGWVRQIEKLVFNFDDFSLQNVKLKNDFHSLSTMGEAEEVVTGYYFDYFDIKICEEDGSLDIFIFYFLSDNERRIFMRHDQELALNKKTSKEYVSQIFGTPKNSKNSETLSYHYCQDDVEFSFYWNGDGCLEQLEVATRDL